jgi:hypothetical protein
MLRPDYDPRCRYVSEYAVGRYHEVMTAAFFALASGSAALLAALAQTLPSAARSTGSMVWLESWTAAVTVAGIFPTDLTGPDGISEHPTPHGTIHGLAGVLCFSSLPLASFVLGRRLRKDPAWRALGHVSIGLSILQAGAVLHKGPIHLSLPAFIALRLQILGVLGILAGQVHLCRVRHAGLAAGLRASACHGRRCCRRLELGCGKSALDEG